jgi:hypothetical protein
MRQVTTAIDGALVLIAVLLLVQMWLLSASLDTFLAGYPATAIPAAIVSGLLFAACLGLFFFVQRVDRESRK